MKHEFVNSMPDRLEPDILYVSLLYDTAMHLCACGCGNEVVTPLSPAQWALTYDGDTVSLSPSIGNWGFPCRSHYFVRKSKVEWSYRYSDREISVTRQKDERALIERHSPADTMPDESGPIELKGQAPDGWVSRLIYWISR